MTPDESLIADAFGDLIGATYFGGAYYNADNNFGYGAIFELASTRISTTDDTTSVNVSTPAVAPTITGVAANQPLTVGSTDTPFAGVTITDANSGAQDTLTITLTGAGTLTDGASFSGLASSGDVYKLTGTASAINSELDALVFTPAAGTPNASATTSFALSDKSSAYATATTNDTTSVNVATPAVAPTITGTVANQPLTVGSTDTPFSSVTIGDINAGAGDTLSITLTGAGTLADGAGFSGLMSSGGGVYTLTGSAGAITSELEALVFTPQAGAPNTSATTSFALSDASSAYVGVSGYESTLTILASFNGGDGAGPYNTLTTDAAGDLFGETYGGGGDFGGGADDFGGVFEIAKTSSGYASTPTLLASFNDHDGDNPALGHLALDASGDLFGTTFQGGSNGAGVVFEIAKTSSGYATTPTVLANFNGSNGDGPQSGLLIDAAGDLFGTAKLGGRTTTAKSSRSSRPVRVTPRRRHC